MSRTTLLSVWHDIEPTTLKEFGNSWGSAPVVWDILWKKYGKPKFEYESYFTGGNLTKIINSCLEDQNAPDYLKAVVLMTCDNSYVAKANYKRAAQDIEKFMEAYPAINGNANHWFSIGTVFEEEKDALAIGFWMTSVSENPFHGEWNEDRETYDPMDWTKTFNVYDEIGNEN